MLSYAVYARERQLLRVASVPLNQSLEENDNQIQEWVRKDEWLRMDFDQVNLLWDESRFSIVPNEFALESATDTLAKHLFETRIKEQLRFSDCGSFKLLYPIHEQVYYSLRSKFNQSNFEHLAGRLLNWYMDPNIDQDFTVVHHGSSIQVMFREGDKLQFCQSFVINNDSEAAYFVLNTMEKLGVNREQVTVRTVGIDEKGPLFHMLDEYIRKVKGINIPLPEALKQEHSLHPFLITKL